MLACQYDAPGTPWNGTFKVTAEEPDPPTDAEEWVHYDPNWRQFVGCILTMIVSDHRDALRPELVARIESALERCVAGEPATRIPRWYTNPNLMHAWLSARIGDPAGDARRRMIVDRFDRHGDVDEYNSPTYDGVDLMALGLWVTFPPNPRFATDGARLLARLGERISRLYHPGLRAVCGPYTRAYGVDLDRYVSFLGMWWAMAGEATLPVDLSATTDHAHDLSFAPVLERLSDAVLPHLEPTDGARSHEQRFGPVTATSVLGTDSMIGAETGRRGTFSRDQYVPLVAHWHGPARVESIALYVDDTTQVDATARSPTHATARVWSEAGEVVAYAAGTEARRAADLLATDTEPAVRDSGRHRSPVELRWPAGSSVELTLDLSSRR